jgi:hypothetical protein
MRERTAPRKSDCVSDVLFIAYCSSYMTSNIALIFDKRDRPRARSLIVLSVRFVLPRPGRDERFQKRWVGTTGVTSGRDVSVRLAALRDRNPSGPPKVPFSIVREPPTRRSEMDALRIGSIGIAWCLSMDHVVHRRRNS